MPIINTLWRQDSPCVLAGCPLVLDTHALTQDLKKRELLLQYRLQNISSRRVLGAELKVLCFDSGGQPLPGCDRFVLSGCELAPGQTWGELTSIPLPDLRTRRVTVIPLKVCFSAGEVWENPQAGAGFTALTAPQTPVSSLGKLEEVYQRELASVGATLPHTYLPQAGAEFSRCGCGAVVPESGTCGQCGARLAELLELNDARTLAARQRIYKRENRQKRDFRWVLALVAVALVLVAGLFVRQIYQPQLQQRQDYRTACTALAEEDYETAEAMFIELGDYKDSQRLLQQAYLEQARQLLDADELDRAAEVLALVENEKKAAPLYYKLGLKYLLSGRFRAAWSAFNCASGYEDAEDMAQEAAEAAAAAEQESAEQEAEEEESAPAGESFSRYLEELFSRSDELWDELAEQYHRLQDSGLFE